jgi:hypothetical protein
MEKNEKEKKGNRQQDSNRDLLRKNKDTYHWATNQFVILVCDFYVCVAYLFNEFFDFNLIRTKKNDSLMRLKPTTSKFAYACITTELLDVLCLWLTFEFIYSIFIGRNKTYRQKKGVERRRGGLNPRPTG